jgi:hypothetical protein
MRTGWHRFSRGRHFAGENNVEKRCQVIRLNWNSELIWAR